MNDNNAMKDYDVMNGNNAMNGNYGMNEVQVKEVMVDPQNVEIKEEQNQVIPMPAAAPDVVVGGPLPWFRSEEVDELKSRWNSIQIKFVDEPRTCVEQADALVADALQRIEKTFADKRAILEQKWIQNADISTEDLRTALQGYRSFFNRLLTL